MTRVLLVWPFHPPEHGAGSLRGAAAARALRDEGADVRVLAPAKDLDPHAEDAGPDEPEGVDVHREPLFFDPGDVLRWRAGRAAMARHLEEHDPDLVLASTPPPMVAWQLLGAVRDADVPLVVDVRDLFTLYMRVSHGRKLRYHVSDLMERRVYHAADALTVTSELQGGLLADRYGVDPAKVHLARNGTDLARYEDVEPADDPAHDVLFLGAFQEGRRGDDLLRAYERVLHRRGPTTFTFLGWRGNAYVEDLRHRWDAPPLRDHLRLEPPVPPSEVPTWLADAKVGVASLPDDPAYLSQVPRKTYDYLAAGLPVVVLGPEGDSEVGGILEDHGAGRYTTTPDAFADAVADLLDDDVRRWGVASDARELGKRFDLQATWRRVWRDVLGPMADGAEPEP